MEEETVEEETTEDETTEEAAQEDETLERAKKKRGHEWQMKAFGRCRLRKQRGR